MLKLCKQLRSMTLRQTARFSGGHVKEYDWRDDEAKNESLYEDPRGKGHHYTEYTTPYQGPADTW